MTFDTEIIPNSTYENMYKTTMESYISIKDVNIFGFNPNAKTNIKSYLINILNPRHKKNTTSHKTIKILHDINFEAKKGDRIGILGPNGCGKTSLLRTICGTYTPESGTVKRKGTVTSMIATGTEFEYSLDAIDNIKISFIYNNRYDEFTEEICKEIIAFAELEEQTDIPIYQYSSGMQARLAFATNIFQRSNILISDEVLATGDARFIHKARKKILETWDTVDIAITVSHDIEDIKELCTTCYVMQKGTIVYYGKTADAIKYYDEIYTNNPTAHR